METARDRLENLVPPSAAATEFERFVSALTTWITDLKTGNTSAATSDSNAVIAHEHAAAQAAGCR